MATKPDTYKNKKEEYKMTYKGYYITTMEHSVNRYMWVIDGLTSHAIFSTSEEAIRAGTDFIDRKQKEV